MRVHSKIERKEKKKMKTRRKQKRKRHERHICVNEVYVQCSPVQSILFRDGEL